MISQQKHFRIRTVLPAALLLLISSGAPKGCNTPGNAGIDPAVVTADSPDVRATSVDTPLVVLRDNPPLVGNFWVTAGSGAEGKGKCSSKCNYDLAVAGKWKGVRPYLMMDEYATTSNGSLQKQGEFLGSMIPLQSSKAPSFLTWTSRTFDLIHENKFRINVGGTYGPAESPIVDGTQAKPLWLKLSDDVALVPVVMVYLRTQSQGPAIDFRTFKSIFDFVPYRQAWLDPEPPSWDDIAHPNGPEFPIPVPTYFQTPPDDIFAQCNIQVQAIARMELIVPGNAMPCDKSGPLPMFGMSQSEIEAAVAATGAVGEYIATTLRPVYVVYAWSDACGLQGHVGKQTGDLLVEVNMKDFRKANLTATAHELGHVFLGPQHVSGAGNLMHPTLGGPSLLPDQCQSARTAALKFSSRYRAYNTNFNRTLIGLDPPDNFRGDVVAPEVVDFAQLAQVCCRTSVPRKPQPVNYSVTNRWSCLAGGGKVEKGFAACSVCCVEGDVAQVRLNDDCATPSDPANCELVCCSDNPTVSVTRYQCEVVKGGEQVSCDFIPQ